MALLTLILEQWPKLVLKSPTKSSVGRGRNQTHLKMTTTTKTMRPPRDKPGEEQPKMSGVKKCGAAWGMRTGWGRGTGDPDSLWGPAETLLCPAGTCGLRCGSFDRSLLGTSGFTSFCHLWRRECLPVPLRETWGGLRNVSNQMRLTIANNRWKRAKGSSCPGLNQLSESGW